MEFPKLLTQENAEKDIYEQTVGPLLDCLIIIQFLITKLRKYHYDGKVKTNQLCLSAESNFQKC